MAAEERRIVKLNQTISNLKREQVLVKDLTNEIIEMSLDPPEKQKVGNLFVPP